MTVFLESLALQNYRGIGPDLQRMAPFRQFNFFIGPNNSGKSTVLNFISKFLVQTKARDGQAQLDPLEKYRGGTKGEPRVAFGIEVSRFIETAVSKVQHESYKSTAAEHISRIANFLQRDDRIWLASPVPLARDLVYHDLNSLSDIRGLLDFGKWSFLWSALTGSSGGGVDQHWIPQSMAVMLAGQLRPLPPVSLIPAKRQIGPKSEDFADYSGRGLIDRLAQIQSPDHDRREERAIFDRINGFVQSVTGYQDALIEIPHNRQHILTHINGNTLPLQSLGTGIAELIMIAAFSTLTNGEILCIEEPEIHLHPSLQRKLIRYLAQNTNNQYFIATHSASFIDTPGASIFRVQSDGTQTTISKTVLRSEKFAICSELGHRASDIIQANCVIWVEGPSDRIYLNHWLGILDAGLIEGVHYSIMFYGGRLLSHLSGLDADAEDIADFISLQSLNQNSIVLMDSDRTVSDGPVNATKERVVSEVNSRSGLAWVTAGREIENYVPYEVLQEAVAAVHPTDYDSGADPGPFSHALHYKKKSPAQGARRVLETKVDKVKVAREVVKRTVDLDVLDLRERMSAVVSFIRAAND